MKVKHVGKNWVSVEGRRLYTGGCPVVVLTAEESIRFNYDDELQRECAAAARAAGLRGLIPCHTIGGPVVGTVEVANPDAAQGTE